MVDDLTETLVVVAVVVVAVVLWWVKRFWSVERSGRRC